LPTEPPPADGAPVEPLYGDDERPTNVDLSAPDGVIEVQECDVEEETASYEAPQPTRVDLAAPAAARRARADAALAGPDFVPTQIFARSLIPVDPRPPDEPEAVPTSTYLRPEAPPEPSVCVAAELSEVTTASYQQAARATSHDEGARASRPESTSAERTPAQATASADLRSAREDMLPTMVRGPKSAWAELPPSPRSTSPERRTPRSPSSPHAPPSPRSPSARSPSSRSPSIQLDEPGLAVRRPTRTEVARHAVARSKAKAKDKARRRAATPGGPLRSSAHRALAHGRFALRAVLMLPVLVNSSDAALAARSLWRSDLHPVAAPRTEAPLPPKPAPDPVTRAVDLLTGKGGTGCQPGQAPDETAKARPDDHAALQLAIEAYQNGRHSEARLLFQSLACRPEVGAAARYMVHLMSGGAGELSSTIPAGNRHQRTHRLLEETQNEIAWHSEIWGQKSSLAGVSLVNPRFIRADFKGEPKCNIFVGEMLYRAGFIAPGTPAPGQSAARYPNVNEMVGGATRVARGEPWDPIDGAQWFDVVHTDEAEPGDLVLISAKHRHDLESEHGHVEIISNVVYDASGGMKEVGTVGAKSSGVRYSPLPGRMFGKTKDGNYQFSQYAMVVRPRLR
jgi:hypothetical protein